MIKAKKEEVVTRIQEWLSDCRVAIVTDYRGLTVSEMTQLRRHLGEAGSQYHVIKNSMARLAADKAGKEELKDLLTGPCAIAFGYGEVSDPARALTEYIRSAKVSLSIRGGLLGKRLLGPDEISALSTLPPRPVLIVWLMQQMQAPISSLQAVLTANLTGIVRVLQARKQQLEGG